MLRKPVTIALIALMCSAPAAAGQSAATPTADDVQAGIQLVEAGDFERGIMVLDGALRKLTGVEHSRQRARVYLHLGIAYLGLAQVEAAKERFRAALGEVGDLTLSMDEFPPKVVDVFEQTRHELAANRVAGRNPVADVAVGNRVRLQSTDAGELRGTVVSMDPRSLVLAGEHGGRLTVARDSITRLELSMGRKAHAVKGLVIGAGVGLSMAITPIDPDDCGMDSVKFCSRGEAISTGILFVGLGALLGAVIKSDRWVPVSLHAPGAAAPIPYSGDIRMAIRLRF